MITFERFHVEHIKYIKPTAVQTDDYRYLLTPGAEEALATGPALSAWASGICLGAAGIVIPWEGRGEAWALLAECSGPYLKPIVRKLRFVLDTTPLRRIDMAVRVSNKSGHALARALRFEAEATLEAFHPSGDDMIMYKRVNRQWQQLQSLAA